LLCLDLKRGYALAVFWFWFWSMINVLMVLSDVAWWIVALRLTRKRLWRILVSVFMAGQMAVVLTLIGEFEVSRSIPKAIVSAVILWHYFLLGALGALGGVSACRWLVQGMTRAARARRESAPVAPAAPALETRREFIGTCAALVPPLFTISLTGVAQAQLEHFRIRRFTLSLPALPRALDGMTIAHVSDTHVGGLTSGRLLREAVNATNALRPDLVLLTGDLINYEMADLPEAVALVKALEGRYGLWMVEGNHDIAVNGGEFEQRAKAAGLPLLLDESAVVEVRGYPVEVFGLSWMTGALGENRHRDRVVDTQLHRMLQHRQPDAFPLLLAHHPHTFDAALKAGLPLTLAGHTHGGQWMLDSQHGIGSVFFRYWSGLYTRGHSHLIVSNGIGNWLPLRINAPAEIIHLTLRSGGTNG
jgi:uncharacterized protein